MSFIFTEENAHENIVWKMAASCFGLDVLIPNLYLGLVTRPSEREISLIQHYIRPNESHLHDFEILKCLIPFGVIPTSCHMQIKTWLVQN